MARTYRALALLLTYPTPDLQRLAPEALTPPGLAPGCGAGVADVQAMQMFASTITTWRSA